jgi:rhodanese-related sulfurtransferase
VEISPEEVARCLAGPGAPRLIDVREPDEFAICRIAGAELIPLSELASVAAWRLSDRSQELVVYCHHGVRSLRAVQWLRARGWSGARSMAGGIEAWSLRVDPAVPRY